MSAAPWPVWLEVHVDDFVLEGNPGRWGDAAALLDTLAGRAEAEGARLSFRIRTSFARGDREGFLVGLQARGHEVGWHTHGRGLRAAVDALGAAGIREPARIGTPGLVQVGDRGRERLLHEARSLGLEVLTDRLEARYFAYQGWLAWEPVPGLCSLDVSVNPFDWGVLRRDGKRVLHAEGTMDFPRLLERVAARDRERPPPGATAYFGATVHEHNFCREGELRPIERALDGLSRFCATLGTRVVASADTLAGGSWPPTSTAPTPRLTPTPLAYARRALSRVTRRLDPTPFAPTDAAPRAIGQHRIRGAPPSWREDFLLRVEDRQVQVRRIGLASARLVVVTAHGGKSGIEQGLSFAGLADDALVAADVAVYLFARSEGQRTPGNPQHVADTRAVLAHALAEGPPVGLLTWSAGVVPALRAAADLPAVRFLMDCEGPCDRFSVVPPRQPAHELAPADVNDDAPWAGREAIRLIPSFPGAYHRIQAAGDHVHGPMWWHAHRMVDHARDGRLNEAGELLPGRLWEHRAAILRWVAERA